MAAGSKQIPPEDTLANLLLTLTALSGEFPTAQVSRLPSTGAYQEKILKHSKGKNSCGLIIVMGCGRSG